VIAALDFSRARSDHPRSRASRDSDRHAVRACDRNFDQETSKKNGFLGLAPPAFPFVDAFQTSIVISIKELPQVAPRAPGLRHASRCSDRHALRACRGALIPASDPNRKNSADALRLRAFAFRCAG
jgi:hypothetical protein